MSDICGKYMYDKFNEIADDTRRMFAKVNNADDNEKPKIMFVAFFFQCKSVGLGSHEDIYKVLNELQSVSYLFIIVYISNMLITYVCLFIQTLKTYHQYQSESKQAEQKLRSIQQQMAKIKSAKKQKAMEKRVEKVINK